MNNFDYEGASTGRYNFELIMDNDSGYISQTIDHESNSNSILDSSSTSTVDILRSFLPKPVYLSEDALLERPDINIGSDLNISAEIEKEDYEESRQLFFSSPKSTINTSRTSNNTNFSGFETDTEVSDSSVVIPIANPIYYNFNDGINSESFTNQFITNGSCIMSSDANSLYSTNYNYSVIEGESNISIDLKSINDNSSSLCNNVCTNRKSVEQTDHRCEQYIENLRDVAISSGIVKYTNVLTNVTNTCDNSVLEKLNSTYNAENVKTSLVVPEEDKENISLIKVLKTPIKINKIKVASVQSPDLFSDDEQTIKNENFTKKVPVEPYFNKDDVKLLKRVQNGLSGVPPPPSFTVINLSVDEILEKIENNKNLFWCNKSEIIEPSNIVKCETEESFTYSRSLLINGKFEESIQRSWPQILESRHHGLHHNRSKTSEEIEHLCDKYGKRFVSMESQSTCTVFETKFVSPSKRKALKQRWGTASPGRRLSHLARRRITFSSANLQSNSSSSANSRARQILVDCRKLELLNRKKSPRKPYGKSPRKTPSKSPVKRRTPSSSAKKKLRMRFRLLSGDFKDTLPSTSGVSKRALFQSPDHDRKAKLLIASSSGVTSFDHGVNIINPRRSLFSSPSKSSSRRSLFSSPSKKSPFKNISFEKKRKRSESDDNSNSSKLFRSMSSELRPAEPEHRSNLLNRSNSEVLPSQSLVDLTMAHKKKLQWAVYEALKAQNITASHPKFKIFASVLARVTRRFVLAANIHRQEGGTSGRMLRIARHHSYSVVKGKSLEEIINDYNKHKMKLNKPQGYVGLEDFQHKQSILNKENIARSSSGNVEKPKLVHKNEPENRIDRIRKVINFEDNR